MSTYWVIGILAASTILLVGAVWLYKKWRMCCTIFVWVENTEFRVEGSTLAALTRDLSTKLGCDESLAGLHLKRDATNVVEQLEKLGRWCILTEFLQYNLDDYALWLLRLGRWSLLSRLVRDCGKDLRTSTVEQLAEVLDVPPTLSAVGAGLKEMLGKLLTQKSLRSKSADQSPRVP